jgi:hypothetical protein
MKVVVFVVVSNSRKSQGQVDVSIFAHTISFSESASQVWALIYIWQVFIVESPTACISLPVTESVIVVVVRVVAQQKAAKSDTVKMTDFKIVFVFTIVSF